MANALSRKSLHVVSLMVKECELLEKLRSLNLPMTIELDRLSLN